MAGNNGINREKAIELAIGSIHKQFGKGAIMRLGEGESITADIETISTGSIGIDVALGEARPVQVHPEAPVPFGITHNAPMKSSR